MHSPADPEPDITINSAVALPEDITWEVIESLVVHVLRSEGVDGEWQLGIEFVDDPTMQAAHVEFMGIDEPTDIMTFPYEDGDDFGDALPEASDAGNAGGDLMISVDRAAENAVSEGWETGDEILFLITHGMLHLLGWDDATDVEREAMLAHQSALITSWREAPEARQ